MSDQSSARAHRAPRVSQRRYVMRRLAVVAVVVLGVFGLVRVAGAVSADSSEDGADEIVEITAGTTAPRPVATSAPETPPSAAGTMARATPVPTPATVTTTAPTSSAPAAPATPPPPAPSVVPVPTVPATAVPTPPPTAADKAGVLVVGDSFAGLWGPPLAAALDGTGLVETQIDYTRGTGLTRPNDFDWFARMQETLPAANPDIVVTSFGGNDFVGMVANDGSAVVGDPVANEAEWTAEYQRRAGAMMDLLAEGGRTVIWVGIANNPDPAITSGLALQDRAAKAAASERPGIVFIDSWDMFSGRDGNWAEYVIDPRDGQGKDVRMDDGYHINQTGADIVAFYIGEAVKADLTRRGAVL